MPPAQSPPQPKGWVLAEWALALQRALLSLCLFYWAIDHGEETERKTGKEDARNRNWDRRRGLWVILSLCGLVVLWVLNPTSDGIKILVGAIAAYRLFEILVTGLGTALGQRAQVRARNLVTIVLYAFQMTLIFAILYHSFATTGFALGDANHGVELRIWDYYYVSWASITSLGNQTFTPITPEARFLEVGTTTAGIFLFGVLLAFGINEAKGVKD